MVCIPEKITELIDATHIPTIPESVLGFMQLVDNENTSIAELAAFIGQDPALTATVLSFANSPSLRGRSTSKDLVHILISIGTRMVRTLATCLVVKNVFSPSYDSQEFDFTGFWGHSLRVAEVARTIAVEIRYADIEEARLAGLLHNIGQLLLLGGLKDRYGLLLAASSDESLLRDHEEKELGTSHAAVGAWLADQWGLSSFMADAILFHQSAADEIVTADTLSQIVWSAHKICHHYAEAAPLDQEQDADYVSVHSMLGIDATSAFTLYQNSSIRVAQFMATMGISESFDARTFPYLTIVPLENVRSPLKNKDGAYGQMAGMVHDLALLQPLQQQFASIQSEAELLLSIRETVTMLFGQRPLAFLMLQSEEMVLSGAGISNQPHLLQQIKIPLDSDQSLAAGVALGKQPYSTTVEQESRPGITLADVQIARILGCEGLLYIPLKCRSRIIGLMVYGVTASYCTRQKKRFPMMARIADMAATNFVAWRERQSRRISDAADATAVVNSVDVNSLIDGMIELYSDSLFTSRGIRIGKVLDVGLSAVACERDIIRQILYYLWKNASETTAAGGCFMLSTHDNINQNGRSYIEVRLSDTGRGMSPEVMEQLFRSPDPDKKRSGHVDRGLAIVAALVQQIDGRITCRSKTGQGTRFSILFPKGEIESQ